MSKLAIKKINPSVTRNTFSSLFGDITSWHNEMDRAFDRLMSNFSNQMNRQNYNTLVDSQMPVRISVDISETDNAYQVCAELAGVEEKDIAVSISDGVLTIEGEKKEEIEDKNKDFHRFERMFGQFKRQISLSNDIDEDKVHAKFENGILKIDLPKCAKNKPEVKTVKINS